MIAQAIAPRTIGGPNDYGPPAEGIMIDRVVKLDLRRDAVAGDASAGGGEAFLEAWTLPDGAWLVSEPTLVPKADGRAGDGVWVLCVGTRTVGDERVASELYKSGADFSFETGRGAT